MDNTRRDKIRNENIPDKVRMTFMVDKLREGRLRWFVKRRCPRCSNKEV